MPAGVGTLRFTMTTKTTHMTYNKRSGNTICSVDGCNKVVLARRMCDSHYSRWYKGRRIEGEVRPWGASLMDVITKVEPEIMAAIDREAIMSGGSRYSVARKIMADWYKLWCQVNGEPNPVEVADVLALREARRHPPKGHAA